jgi:hypothetical protein
MLQKAFSLWLIIATWFVFPAFADGQDAQPPQSSPELAIRGGEILQRACVRCHHGSGSESGYAFNVLSAKQNQSNVFQFVINELGKGAATARQSRSGRGVIHVQFFEVVPEGLELPARSFGEVGTGKPIDVSYGLRQMQRRETPIANIAIRYTEK